VTGVVRRRRRPRRVIRGASSPTRTWCSLRSTSRGQISGWYDDSRGPIDYTNALNKVAGHPFIRLVMGPGAHKGVDYVAGEFGPQSRVDTRRLQLRWFDHYLLGRDNGVDREPPVDVFVFGDNAWRKEAAWALGGSRATAR